jgi:unsaturated chondroitin disaccharide hydrolase
LAAADELVALERSNARAGTIPTNPVSGNTIIDSMMNIAILPWATRVTGNPVYVRVALRHARVVASVLVRRDGSTAQSVNFDRASGRVLYVSTHQGLSASSTWSRGQGWAVYGFSSAALQLHDAGLLRVAVRTASYVARRLPAGGIPRWDYDAPAGAPIDVSAGVITAAGLMHLVAACHALPGVCAGVGRWRVLARRMLAAALGRASAQPPLGLLRDQVLNERGRGCWCDGGELIFGLTYGLEAESLLRRGGTPGRRAAGP